MQTLPERRGAFLQVRVGVSARLTSRPETLTPAPARRRGPRGTRTPSSTRTPGSTRAAVQTQTCARISKKINSTKHWRRPQGQTLAYLHKYFTTESFQHLLPPSGGRRGAPASRRPPSLPTAPWNAIQLKRSMSSPSPRRVRPPNLPHLPPRHPGPAGATTDPGAQAAWSAPSRQMSQL